MLLHWWPEATGAARARQENDTQSPQIADAHIFAVSRIMRWWPQLRQPLNSFGVCAGPAHFCPILLPQPKLAVKTPSSSRPVCSPYPSRVCGNVRLAPLPKVFTQLRKALCFLEKVGQLPPVSWRWVEEWEDLAGLRRGSPGGTVLPSRPRGLTYVTIVHPDAVAIIPGPALHDVVGVVRLRHLVVGIDDNLGESQFRGDPASATLHHRPGCDAETRPASRAGLSSRDRAKHGRCCVLRAEGRV